MSNLSHNKKVKRAFQGLIILAVITAIEVFLSLLHRGHLISGLEKYNLIFYTAALLIIGLSFYKAYFIIYEFMHLKYEAKSFAKTVLLPTVLLIWLIIAFLWDGDRWGYNKVRDGVDDIEKVEYLKGYEAPTVEDVNIQAVPSKGNSSEKEMK